MVICLVLCVCATRRAVNRDGSAAQEFLCLARQRVSRELVFPLTLSQISFVNLYGCIYNVSDHNCIIF
jgi:hypothetical protein